MDEGMRVIARCLMLVCGMGAGAMAMPAGVWIRESRDGDCCRVGLEIAADGSAYCMESGDMVSAKVDEAGDSLRVEMGGETRWVFTRDGAGWRDQRERRWLPREAVVKTDPAWTEVKIRMKDQKGPIPHEIGIRYEIDSAAGSWDPLLVRPLEARSGSVILKAPDHCTIRLWPEHPDFVRGANSDTTVLRRDGAKELTAEFRRGRSFRGKVVDAATGGPVAGARVSPQMFTPPLFSPDPARAVVTGADGDFEVRGVDFSISAEHADYVEETVYLVEKNLAGPVVVKLKRGHTARGVVSDAAGKPLGAVMVEDGTGKRALTDGRGAFELRGLRQWSGDSWYFSFSKEGFNDLSYRSANLPADGLNVALQPRPLLKGRVVNENRDPVRRFRVVCGPGNAPPDYQCETLEVDDADGRFAILPDSLPETGDAFWIGVRADGAAPWEAVVSRAELIGGSHEIRLRPGVALGARVVLPGSAKGGVSVSLVPNDRKAEGDYVSSPHPGVDLASYAWQGPAGEVLRLTHLRPGGYELRVRCEGAAPMLRRVTIADRDVDLGELRLAGTGTIHGTMKDPYKAREAWCFASGQVLVDGFKEPVLNFKTDKDGKFRVGSVPAGKVEVVFPYLLSADMVGAVSTEVTVPEGGEVEVRFTEKPTPEPEGGPALPELPDLPSP